MHVCVVPLEISLYLVSRDSLSLNPKLTVNYSGWVTSLGVFLYLFSLCCCCKHALLYFAATLVLVSSCLGNKSFVNVDIPVALLILKTR